MFIGVAGGTGSGKTTLTNNICRKFTDNVTVIRHDNYYKPHDDLTYEQRAALNYDHPDAFETDRMVRDLRELKNGLPVECPLYDYSVHNRASNMVSIIPTRVIIAEGILILENLELCRLLDIKIFVDADADVRILRRIVRDVKERGRSLDSVIDQYLGTVKPMHEKFVEPSKKNADLIVPEGGNNSVALDLLMFRIAEFIKSN
jgi:uridine kinase